MKSLLLQLLLASFAAVRARNSPYRLLWVSCTGSGGGMDIVGTAVLSSLRSKGLDVEGSFVPYPANTPRDASTQQGAKQLASDMTKYASQCSNQTFILGGYSQGVIVIHRASLPQYIIKRIAAITVFGDPVPGNSFYPICEMRRVVATCGNVDEWCNDPAKGPRNKEGGVQNLPGPGNHQDYGQKIADDAVNAVMDSIKRPFSGTQCALPPQPQIQFDPRLNFA